MALEWPLRFGSFISPIHAPDENPTLAIHRDVALIQRMDDLGYDEAWMGEHHSTGWEYVGSPEVFLAYAAARTTRIKLGTGVVSLPYHHPFNVAERAVLLDHLTRGRFILGVGPGALAYDAKLFGLRSSMLRPMMEESLEAVMALLRGERISRTTEGFTLVDAQLQLQPYSRPCFEVAVTCTVSPVGAKLAGRHGVSMLSLNATQTAGIGGLRANWEVAEEQAAKHGQSVDRRNWRMVGPMHVAETREQARAEVAIGLARWIYYNTKVGTLGLVPETASTTEHYIDALIEGGFAVIGTPDDAAAQLERLWEASGGFGTFLFWAHDWARREATLRSYELFAQQVIPRFQGQTATLREAQAYALRHRPVLAPQATEARRQASEQYAEERADERRLANIHAVG
ncbi:MAG: LLM class flavin-dependent oxidoreductase [Janthinobacterium lividum]